MPDNAPTTEPDGPRAAALFAAAGVPLENDASVEFHSRGRLLIIGTSEDALCAASALAESLSCNLLTDGPKVALPGVTVDYRRERRLLIDGHLGAFRVQLEGPHETLDLGAAVYPARPVFDLVLDLGAEPAFARDWGPPGYFRPLDEAQLVQALAELPQTTGHLQKPKFFDFDATICAHGKPGIEVDPDLLTGTIGRAGPGHVVHVADWARRTEREIRKL